MLLTMDTQPRSPPPRPLKRSASTASISLLTPPRTYRRRARGRSRGSCDSDSDDDARRLSDDDELPVPDCANEDAKRQHKRRKLSSAKTDDAEEEDRFWGAPESSTKTDGPKPSTSAATRSKKPLLYQRFKTQSVTSSVSSEQGLVSPPPSHRKPALVVPPVVAGPSTPSPGTRQIPLPVTPVKARGKGPRHRNFDLLPDSPNNPFKSTPIDEADEEVESPSALNQGDESPTPAVYDKPHVTYVL